MRWSYVCLLWEQSESQIGQPRKLAVLVNKQTGQHKRTSRTVEGQYIWKIESLIDGKRRSITGVIMYWIFFWFIVKLCKGAYNQIYFVSLCALWTKLKIWTYLIKNDCFYNALITFYWLLDSKSIWRSSAPFKWKNNQGQKRVLHLPSPSSY